MREKEEINCPLCGLAKYKIFITSDKERIVKCLGCNLIYVNPRPTEDYLEKFFKEEFIKNQSKVIDQYGGYVEKTLMGITEIVKVLKKEGRILDIGCAGGTFLSNFSGSSWERYGIEPSGIAASIAKEKGIKISGAYLKNAKFPDDYFDVVCLLDVLYYFLKPVDEMKEVRRILKNDGIIVVSLPGLKYQLLKNTGIICYLLNRRWSRLYPGLHFTYFSEGNVRELFQRTGFKTSQLYIERFPVRDGFLLKWFNMIYAFFSRMVYLLTFQKLNLGAKLVYIGRTP